MQHHIRITIFGNRFSPEMKKLVDFCDRYMLQYNIVGSDEETPRIYVWNQELHGYDEFVDHYENTIGGFGDGKI